MTKRNFWDKWYGVILLFLIVFFAVVFVEELFGMILTRFGEALGLSDGMRFVLEMYAPTIMSIAGLIFYLHLTKKKNQFILDSFKLGYKGNSIKSLMVGLLVGFIMNFFGIAAALIHGDIKLYLDFAISQIPFFLFALVCVFVQSTSEELWCRGFLYERLAIGYPLWVAVAVNGLLFAALHLGNDGMGVIPFLNILICGLSFSLAKWYTGSIWFPMGIHTMWNFTQNFLFGLPNSGLVSETSVFKLDAASSSLIYDHIFGVEGGIPGVLADLILGLVFLYLGYKNGRLHELTDKM